MFSIFMTSLVNLVLIEITTSSDQSAGWALGLFLALFVGVLYRDVHAFLARQYGESSVGAAEAGRWRSGGLGSASSINASGVSYAQILNPDDEVASRAILSSFEKQHRLGDAAPAAPAPASGSLFSGALQRHLRAPSSLRRSYRRLVRWLGTVQGQLVVPHAFMFQIGSSSLLCILLLTRREWSTTWGGLAWKRVVYATLSISLAFSLAYLLLTAWRLVRIVALAGWRAGCGRHGRCNCCFGQRGWAPTTKDVGMHGDGDSSGSGSGSGLPFAGASSPSASSSSLSAQLSAFAHTSLVFSIAQLRIMGACALISGVYFGTMFGGLDKEDATKRCAPRPRRRGTALACTVLSATASHLASGCFLCSFVVAVQPHRRGDPARELLLVPAGRVPRRHLRLRKPVPGALSPGECRPDLPVTRASKIVRDSEEESSALTGEAPTSALHCRCSFLHNHVPFASISHTKSLQRIF